MTLSEDLTRRFQRAGKGVSRGAYPEVNLGGRDPQICVRSEGGDVVEEQKHATRTLRRYLKGREQVQGCGRDVAEAFGVATSHWQLGHEVRVVPASLVRSLGVGSRNLKTDERDAPGFSARFRAASMCRAFTCRGKSREIEKSRDPEIREQLRRRSNATHGLRAPAGWLRGPGDPRAKPGDREFSCEGAPGRKHGTGLHRTSTSGASSH